MPDSSPTVQPIAHRATIQPSGLSVLVQPGETIVDALRRVGYRTRYKCRRGGCGVCRATLLSGKVTYRVAVCDDVVRGSDPPESAGEPCLPCRATPETDVEIELGPNDHVVHVLGAIERSISSADLTHDSAVHDHTP